MTFRGFDSSNSQFEQNMHICWLGLPNPKPFLLDLAIQQSHIENCCFDREFIAVNPLRRIFFMKAASRSCIIRREAEISNEEGCVS